MIYEFGDFRLDTGVGNLTGPEGPVSLRRQTYRVLVVLLEHAPELVDHNTLLDEAWGHSALTPSVLPQSIGELRQALGDQAQSPQFIETLHRRGYRMICPVTSISASSSEPDNAELEEGANEAISAASRLRNLFPWAAVILAVTALGVIGGLWWHDHSQRQWLQQYGIPEVRELMESDLASAWRYARELRMSSRTDPQLEQLWLDLSLPVTLTSKPPGASVAIRGYHEADHEWITLGVTPLEDIWLPMAMLQVQVSLEGHASVEAAPSLVPRAEPFVLHPTGEAPHDMVFIPAGPVNYMHQQKQLPDFWIDRHEVTNRQFRQFVRSGGYQNPQYWQHRAHDGGKPLDWEDLVERLVDTTGMPGPAGWAMGTYPPGTKDHPVEGISWYEAAAYAEFVGKQLPSVFHWYRAAGLGTAQSQNFSDILLISNFNGKGTIPVGSSGSLGQYGALDMPGNVAEWCYNADGHLRHILGGSWMDSGYTFRDPNAQHPLERRPGFGLRLIHQHEPLDSALLADVAFPEVPTPEPIDDETFGIYTRLFDYDPLPLDAQIEEIDNNHPDWRLEVVSFAAAYPGERVTARLYLPRASRPPYQTIIHYPGGDALLLDDSRKARLHHTEPFLRSGRAVVFPIYQGTFERKLPGLSGPVGWRDLLVRQVQDMRRTIDYLETREDIDTDRLALHGASYGGYRAPYALAVEDRFRTAMLVSAGLVSAEWVPDEVKLKHYLPRVRLPILLINGRDDFNFPHQQTQLPFFELLGTPADEKQHLVLDWGHLPPHYTDVMRAYMAWSDRWLGPVAMH